MSAAAAGRLTAPRFPVTRICPAAPAAAHQHAIVRTLLVFCLLAGGFAAGQTAAQAVSLTSLQPEAASLQPQATADLNFVRAYQDCEIGLCGLDAARHIAVNSDGSRLFVTGDVDNAAVTAAEVDKEAGTLRRLDLERASNVDGLGGASALALSPDDDSLLFITAATDNALSVWRVDAASGALGLSDRHKDGEGGIDGLDTPSDLAVSPNGRLVFVVSEGDDALSVWQVVDAEASSPTITQSALYKNGSDGIDCLDGASALALSPDGRLLFVAAAADNALSVWFVNAADGTLELAGTYKNEDPGINGLDGASDLALSPDGRLLFAASETGDALSVWQVDAEAGTIAQSALYLDDDETAGLPDGADAEFDGLDGASDITLSSDGNLLFVTARIDDTLSVWEVDTAAGTLMQSTLYRDGSGGADGLDGAFAVALSPDDSLLFVTGNDDNTLSLWRIVPISRVLSSEALMIRAQVGSAAPTTETLVITATQGEQMITREATLSTGEMSATAVFQARTLGPGRWTFEVTATRPPGALNTGSVRTEVLVVHPPLGLLSLQAESNARLQPFRATADLNFVRAYQDSEAGFFGLDAARHIAVNSDGSRLFVTGDVGNSAVTVAEVDKDAGTLQRLNLYRDSDIDGLGGASALALSPDDSLLFITAATDNALSMWRVNAGAGTLEQTDLHKDGEGGIDGLDTPSDLAVSPDGSLVFVVSEGDDALSIWQVDAEASTPTITQSALYRDGSGGIDGLAGAAGIAISPDGSLLFVAAIADNALSVWRVNAVTGILTQTQLHKESGGIDGLAGAADIVVSPDGRLLFVTALFDSLTVWRVNASFGTVEQTDLHRDGSRGIDGLDAPSDIALSSDGNLLFVTAQLDDTLSVWKVNAAAGTLTQSTLYRDGSGGIDGLDGAFAVALSPDDSLLFVTGNNDDTLSLWRIRITVIPRVLSSEALMIRAQVGSAAPETTILVIAAMQGEQIIEKEATLLAGDMSAAAVFEADTLGLGRWTFEVTATRPPTDVEPVRAQALVVPRPLGLLSLQVESNAPLRPQATADLNFIRAYQDCEIGLCGLDAARHIAVNSDGSRLFVTGDVDNAAVTVAEVDKDVGTLLRLDLERDSNVDGLGGASALALSPDDSLLYIIAATDNALSMWRVNAGAGTLEQTDLHKDGEGGIDGLDTPSDLAVSPDGRLVFVVSQGDDALSVWQVDAEASTPTITQSALYRDGSGGIDCLDGASALALSPDGSLLFVAAATDDALSVWRVNATDGTLELAQTYKNEDPGINGLDGASELALSPDGRLLFAASEAGDALSVWQVDAEAGTIAQSALYLDDDETEGLPDGADAEFDGLDGASDITLSSDGNLLFVTARVDDTLSVWEVNAAAGALTQSTLYRDGSNSIDGLDGAFDVALSPDDSLLFVTGNDDNTLSLWRIVPISRVLSSEALMIRAQVGSAAPETVTLVIAATQGEQIIEKEATLLAGDMSAAAVFEAGTLGPGRWTFEVTATRPPRDVEPVRVQALVVQPQRVTLELTVPEMPLMQGADLMITVAATPAPTAELNVQVSLTGQGVTEVMKTATLTMESPSQELVFIVPDDAPETLQLATQTRADEFLATVTEVTATVTVIQRPRLLSLQPEAARGLQVQAALYRDGVSGIDGLDTAGGIAVSPDGSLLFVTAEDDNALSVWQVDAETGALTQSALYRDSDGSGNFDGLGGAVGLALSPDGSLLFVTAEDDNALSVWRVNAGDLEQTQLFVDGSSGIDGLDGAEGLAINTDGSLLFVTAKGDDALSVWQVDAEEGTLTQSALYKDDNKGGDFDGLDGARGVTLSPDGSLLFVTSEIDDALSVWQVDAEASTPTITQSALYRDRGDFDGLDGAVGLALSPDGSLLFVTSRFDDALNVFRVSASAGTLDPLNDYRDGVSGINGLDGAFRIAISPDGSLLFVTARNANALSVWRVNTVQGSLEQSALYRDDSRGGDFDGLDGASGLALSPDGSLLFVTSRFDDALSVWYITRRVVLLMEEIMIRARISEALQQDVTLVIAAMQGEQMIAREATLLAGETSAAAVFEAGALGTTGHWTIEVTETRPPDALAGLESVRAEVLVVQPQLVTLELSAPQTQLVRGEIFTVTVAAVPAPMTQLNVQVSLTGGRVTEVPKTATLTMDAPSQGLTFTVPENALRTLVLATQTTVEDVLLTAVTEATAMVAVTVTIQPLDFLVPQGTVTADDLVFALRHFILCQTGCDEAMVRGLAANLPPLHAGMDAAAIANINTDIDLTIATVTEDNADAPGIVALLQYLSEIPGEILPPANEGARQDALGLEPAQ